jgi:hypothetical protein
MPLTFAAKKQILLVYMGVPAASVATVLNDVSDSPSLSQNCLLT